MTRVLFKRIEKSEFAKDLVLERIDSVMGRFPDLNEHRVDVTLSMENSPFQAGPDVFTVKLFISGRRYRSMVIEKSASNLYVALADVVDHALERLNRYGDKKRVRRRREARKARVVPPLEGEDHTQHEEFIIKKMIIPVVRT